MSCISSVCTKFIVEFDLEPIREPYSDLSLLSVVLNIV